ncbi:uncharacterized protein METZ01_LOCUS154542, partial [marine metagenome]
RSGLPVDEGSDFRARWHNQSNPKRHQRGPGRKRGL